MTQQTINLGPSNNPSSGDSLRIALTKSNSNFNELYLHTVNYTNPHETTAAQVGAVSTTLLGVANGVATLGSDGKLLSSQVPAGGGSGVNLGAPVVVTSLENNQILVYDATDSEWINESRPYNPSGFCSEPPIGGQVIHSFIAPANAVLNANFTGSAATCVLAPVGTAIFTIFQNSTIIGTITFASSAFVGTFTAMNSSPMTVTANDMFYVSCSTADSAIGGIAFFLAGSLT